MNLVWAFLALAVALGIAYRFLRWLYDLGWTHGFERGRLRGERDEIVRRAQIIAEHTSRERMLARLPTNGASGCTGAAASWCPIHGACTCPYDTQVGYRREDPDGIDERCPLHGETSHHGARDDSR